MSDAPPTSIRIREELRQRYDALAAITGRSRSELMTAALEQYVDAMLSEVMAIQDSMAELEEGLGIPHEVVMAELLAKFGPSARRGGTNKADAASLTGTPEQGVPTAASA
jgi:predicted transcriptional regulator